MAPGGRATILLFPTVAATGAAARAERCRSLAEADFFSAKTEDRYPDIFGLALTDSATREHVRAIARERLACLPHHAVTLGHDITANIDMLSKIVLSI